MKKLLLMACMAGFIMTLNQSCKKQAGCTIPHACNYDAEAETDDGSCSYASTWYEDKDGDGLGDPNSSTTECSAVDGYVDNADDDNDAVVTNKQRAVFLYRGATWCPPCGSYGDPTKEYVHSTYGDDCIVLSSQSNDLITSSGEFGHTFGSQFQSFSSVTSVPHGYWVGEGYYEHRGFYSSASANNSAASADIDAINANTASVGIAAEASMSGGSINVNVKVKFFSAASSERYISVFLVENDVLANQSTTTGTITDAPHDHIIRETATSSSSASLGLESLGSSFAAGKEVTENYTFDNLNSGWNTANMDVAIIVWDATSPDGVLNAYVTSVN